MHPSGDFEITPQEAARRFDAGEIELVDVREQFEWDAGRVPGSRHVPMQEISSRAEEIDTDRPIAFICLVGMRSGMVADAFRNAGYEAYNVSGGFQAWFDLGLPTEPKDATVATN